MSRLSSPKEQTWSQLQERLRKSCERKELPLGAGLDDGTAPSRRRSVPPNPLPRIDSPSQPESLRLTSPELRGSHYSRVPPVQGLPSHRPQSDDRLSLKSHNSETTPEPPLAPQSYAAPPYISNGTAHSAPEPSYREVPAWDQYTGRRAGTERREMRDGRRGKKYYVRQGSRGFEDDAEELIYANHLETVDARRRDRYPDSWSRGEGPRLVEYDDVLGPIELPRVPTQRQESSAVLRMHDELFARTFLEYFLTSCLQDDMVLEVAVDVMSNVREERDLERQLSWPVLDMGREILEEVVHENLRDMAFVELRASIKGFWSMVLETPSIYKPIARDLLREVIDDEVASVVPEAISELVTEYFVQKDVVVDFNVMCDEVIASLLPDIILEAVYDESIESLVEGIIQDEIVSLASSFVEDSFATGRPKLPVSPAQRLQDQSEIKALADTFLLDAAIFENMLATRLLPNQQVWTDEEYLDLYLDSLLLDQVLGQQLEVAKRRDYTEHCLPLKRFHEKITTNLAIDVVLEEMTGHLDEDMAEMDEYEVETDRTLKFESP
eukprot:XP_001179020.2 PREDICTED: uncharacterized protein LOC752440 [Strongylocentrotus purpuratus]